jgi:hypothetical protein
MRPNILCLFRMVSGAKASEIFNVVRINPDVFADPKFEVPNYKTKKTKPAKNGFRSHSSLLTDRDVYTAVLGHELGHAINEDHILALKGDAQCKVNPSLDRCYGLTPGKYGISWAWVQKSGRSTLDPGSTICKISSAVIGCTVKLSC